MKKRLNLWLWLGILILIALSFLFDVQIIKFVEGVRNFFLDYIFLAINFSSSALIVFLFLVSLFMYRESKRKWVLPIVFSILLTFLVSFILKILIKRPRPFDKGIVEVLIVAFYFIKDNFNSWNFSFPSMEAMLVFSVLPIISKEFKKFRCYWLVFACLVGFSRVYFGAHYLSDVVAGGVIGYFIGYFIVLLEEKHKIGFGFMKKIKVVKK